LSPFRDRLHDCFWSFHDRFRKCHAKTARNAIRDKWSETFAISHLGWNVFIKSGTYIFLTKLYFNKKDSAAKYCFNVLIYNDENQTCFHIRLTINTRQDLLISIIYINTTGSQFLKMKKIEKNVFRGGVLIQKNTKITQKNDFWK
jgi:hypothetical protein